MNEYVTVNYETIDVIKKRNIVELCNSSLLNAFSEQDYIDLVSVFKKVVNRLESEV